jgi:hypothetical protein
VETVHASSVWGLEPHRALDIRRVIERRRNFPGQAIAGKRRCAKTGGDSLGTRLRCHTQRANAGEQDAHCCEAVFQYMRFIQAAEQAQGQCNRISLHVKLLLLRCV